MGGGGGPVSRQAPWPSAAEQLEGQSSCEQLPFLPRPSARAAGSQKASQLQVPACSSPDR